MERNENGRPVRQNGTAGNNVIENFFEGGACQNGQNGACQSPESGTGSGQFDGCQNPENGDTGMDLCLDSAPLAYAYMPMQKWRRLYSAKDGLTRGTLFEELDKPLGVYGNE